MDGYRDRREAGQALVAAMKSIEWSPEVVVVGLPRGGVVCGREVADALGVGLDVVLVRKLGFPGHRELAFGAIASGGFRFINQTVASLLSDRDMNTVAEREERELARRQRVYGRATFEATGKDVVIVDDGLATGATMEVAVEAVRTQLPGRIVVAVPVAPVGALDALRADVEIIVCPLVPANFRSVGEWYQTFDQVTDAEVVELLNRDRPDSG